MSLELISRRIKLLKNDDIYDMDCIDNIKENICNYTLFNTQEAFTKDKKIVKINNYNDENIYCKNKHKLCFVNSIKKKKYFRHVNSSDIHYDMTIWHKEWQNKFQQKEHVFKKKNNSVCDRRADIYIKENDLVIELQHSYIDKEEVNNRNNDYKLYNNKVLWLIHGEDTVNITIHKTNEIELKFKKELWKSDSYEDCDIIYIEVDNLIYKAYPKYIKNYTINVDEPYTKKQFIKMIENNEDELFNINVLPQYIMYIKQQGAGNGKTYNIVQMLQSDKFEKYDIFIIITKLKSAKSTIQKELKEQEKEGKISDINIISEQINTKFIIGYRNTKYNKTCKLIIATVDSLMFSLGDKVNKTNLNIFKSLVQSIINDYNPTEINFANNDINKFNKNMCLIIDETQDLDENYGKAIEKMMVNYHINTYIVGDKLQSLMHENNGFTYLLNSKLKLCRKIIDEPINICRRFKSTQLIDFVNNMIDFKKFNLPEIQKENLPEDIKLIDDPESIVIFEGTNIKSSKNIKKNNGDDTDNDNEDYAFDIDVITIIGYIIKELKNDCTPKDILIVTPFTRNNPLCDTLEIAINMALTQYYKPEKYTRYAYFHKSDLGNSINLDESENCVRIVSIHTSKGDGRKIVFVIGVDEQSLRCFSKEKDNLIYTSLLHVAITRATEKLYFRIVNNNDDICKKISKLSTKEKYIIEKIRVSKFCKFKDIISSFNNEQDYLKIKDFVNNKYDKVDKPSKNNKLIDLGYHLIRYITMQAMFYISLLCNLNNLEKNERKQLKEQITRKLENISKCKIQSSKTWEEHYNNLKEHNHNYNYNVISILDIYNKENYKYIHNIQYEYMKFIKNKIKEILDNEDKKYHICSYEAILIVYMLNTEHGMYSPITISEFNNITIAYNNSYQSNKYKGHQNCNCDQSFKNEYNDGIENTKLKTELVEHYEISIKTMDMYNSFFESHPNINWLVHHNIWFSGENKDFKIKQTFDIIGYDDNEVYLINLKPQINDINEEEIKLNDLYNTFLLYNIKESDDNNFIKFGNKKIAIITFALNKDEYIKTSYYNIVKSNNIQLLLLIKEKFVSKLSIDYKYLSQIYISKYILKSNDISDKKFIDNIINEFKKEKDIIPIKVFERLKYKYEENKNVLEEYKNYLEFDKLVQHILEDMINQYFGLD